MILELIWHLVRPIKLYWFIIIVLSRPDHLIVEMPWIAIY